MRLRNQLTNFRRSDFSSFSWKIQKFEFMSNGFIKIFENNEWKK